MITIAIRLRYDYDTTAIRLRSHYDVIWAISLYHNCESTVSTTIRLRYDNATTHSTTTEVIEITIRLRYDYDPTTTYRARLLPFDAIRREQKLNMSIFPRSHIAVDSNANRNFYHFRRSRMRRGIVVSWSYRSRIAL